nr:MAG TPA: hypothetical protein [Caudoviricetes sp.]
MRFICTTIIILYNSLTYINPYTKFTNLKNFQSAAGEK